MTTHHRTLLYAGVATFVASLTIVTYAYTRSSGNTETLITKPITRGDIVQAVNATGALEAVTTVTVGTQVSGTIATLRADFNSIVHKGEVIATLDPALFKTQIAQARADLAVSQAQVEGSQVMAADAQAQLSRARQLSEQSLIPDADLQAAVVAARTADAQVLSAQAGVRQAEAALAQTQVALANATITAPIDGIVIARNVDVGQTVAASVQAPTLFVIAADLSEMRLSASIDESDVGMIAAGQPVTFHVGAYPKDTFTGTVYQLQLNPIVDQNVVSYAAIIDVPNKDLKLKPGMTAEATIVINKRADVLRVPNAALQYRPDGAARADGNGVWTASKGVESRTAIDAGLSDGSYTEVVAGNVAEGTSVVTGRTTASQP